MVGELVVPDRHGVGLEAAQTGERIRHLLRTGMHRLDHPVDGLVRHLTLVTNAAAGSVSVGSARKGPTLAVTSFTLAVPSPNVKASTFPAMKSSADLTMLGASTSTTSL